MDGAPEWVKGFVEFMKWIINIVASTFGWNQNDPLVALGITVVVLIFIAVLVGSFAGSLFGQVVSLPVKILFGCLGRFWWIFAVAAILVGYFFFGPH